MNRTRHPARGRRSRRTLTRFLAVHSHYDGTFFDCVPLTTESFPELNGRREEVEPQDLPHCPDEHERREENDVDEDEWHEGIVLAIGQYRCHRHEQHEPLEPLVLDEPVLFGHR